MITSNSSINVSRQRDCLHLWIKLLSSKENPKSVSETHQEIEWVMFSKITTEKVVNYKRIHIENGTEKS